jgi:hypothetical protein
MGIAALRFNVGMVDTGVTGEEPVVRWARERLDEGKRREARRAVDELAARGTDPDTLASAAEFFAYLDDADAAILYGRRAARLAPDNARAWRVLARSYKQKRRRARAVAAARRAVAIEPNAVENLIALAEVLDSPGPGRRRRDEASRVLATAAAVAPQDPRPGEAHRTLERGHRVYWKRIIVWALILGGPNFLLTHLHGVPEVVFDAVFAVLFVTVIVLGTRLETWSRGQTLRERMRTRRARAREDEVRDDDDLIATARGWTMYWPLVTMLILGPHVVAGAVAAPFPHWTLVFPVLGAAAWGGAVWLWSGWWFGPGVARRAVRLSAPLRHQLALAAGLIVAGVALLATGIQLPLVWTLTTLALISWGLAGPFTLAPRSQRT